MNKYQVSWKINNSKKKILIIDDSEMNREILSVILRNEYEIITAVNGEEGFLRLEENYRELSLVLLDVYMPVCDGFEFLEKIKLDRRLSSVPVIVATGSDNPEDEVKCLKLGASDFVTKPYNPEVVRGRVHSIIKLRESVATLSTVEYDELTGILTMSAFQHYAGTILANSQDEEYTLLALDLKGFKLINSLFGEKKGDEILVYVGSLYKKMKGNFLVARQGDKFFMLCPTAESPSEEVCISHVNTLIENAPVSNLKIKVGMYTNVDKTQPVSILCDRVVMALNTIKEDFTRNLVKYDEKMQLRLIENQKMESDFERAIKNEEFVVWYQPKIDVNTEKMVAAEALVRWVPAGGSMIPPGKFIPLFEHDGLVSRLDEYVFRKVCDFQKSRLMAGKKVLPVSINLSRNSIYENGTVQKYADIAINEGINLDLIPIELTESAAVEGYEVKYLAEKFSEAGFSLHMDDFGKGYSSLSSLTTMPFKVIKLDKSLTDRIGNSKGDTIIRHMIDIAHEMGMKIVAEGVEERKQVDFLKSVGCDMIQGYFFSPPRNEEIYTEMLDNI